MDICPEQTSADYSFLLSQGIMSESPSANGGYLVQRLWRMSMLKLGFTRSVTIMDFIIRASHGTDLWYPKSSMFR